MAKNSFKTSFTKAKITKEEGKYIITEYLKDETKVYDFSAYLDGLIETEGLTVNFNKDSELTPIE